VVFAGHSPVAQARSLTPGAIQSSDTGAICTPGWAEAHRDVSYAGYSQLAAVAC
jgi:hypothetical protein